MTRDLRILIVDDHSLLLDALELYLKPLAEPLQVWRATSMFQALSIRDTVRHFDLVLLDLRMPDMDGLEGMRHLREQDPNLRVVIMSGDDTPETVKTVMDAGANGFIPKTLRGPAFQTAISRVLAGGRYVPEGPELHPAPSTAGAQIHLTDREREVLVQLVDGQPNKEIARRLGIEVVTVTMHLGKVYRKLGVTGRTQAVRRAIELHLPQAS